MWVRESSMHAINTGMLDEEHEHEFYLVTHIKIYNCGYSTEIVNEQCKGPATRNDIVNDIFATLKKPSSTMDRRRYRYVWHGLNTGDPLETSGGLFRGCTIIRS